MPRKNGVADEEDLVGRQPYGEHPRGLGVAEGDEVHVTFQPRVLFGCLHEPGRGSEPDVFE